MKKALSLAVRGRGTSSPNPMVGAVIVRKGQVVGSGYHKQPGGPHAEILALHKAGSKARGATLYVTLEPCCHTNKRTPPCVPELIESEIRRVVVAMPDPNPKVSGRGIRKLRQAGIAVEVGCLQKESAQLNEAYIHWMKTGRPFVILKTAMTLDGKIATATGKSKWITGPRAREHVHQLRSQVDAILVGINTVLKDDPQLTVRLPRVKEKQRLRRSPLRVILDSHLRIPFSARVLQHTDRHPTLIVTTSQAKKNRIGILCDKDVEVLVLPSLKNRVSIPACLNHLGQKGITSLLVEGGGEINASFIRRGGVNRLMLYIAPTVFGGQDAKGWLGGISSKKLNQKIEVTNLMMTRMGKDVLVTASL